MKLGSASEESLGGIYEDKFQIGQVPGGYVCGDPQ